VTVTQDTSFNANLTMLEDLNRTLIAIAALAPASEEGGKMLPPTAQAAHKQAAYLAVSFK
jgi:NADH dehydrogenase FAD-containing subunit